jgi:hypothetical protein
MVAIFEELSSGPKAPFIREILLYIRFLNQL